jgi:hypothetical protein
MQAEWYYAENRQQLGPITWIELRDLVDEGRIGPEDLVWRDGLADWVRAATVPGLCADRLPAAALPQAALVDKPAHDLYAREKRRAVRRLVNEDGMSPGIKMILWVGGAVAALIVVGVLLFVLTRVRVGPGEWQVVLAPQQTEERTVTFRGGQTVNITVTVILDKDKDQRPNLELSVFPRHGNMPLDVARNPENPSLTFFSQSTQSYRVRLVNRGQNQVTCTVRHN